MIIVRDKKILKEYKNSLFTVYLKRTGILVVDVDSENTYDTEEVKQIIDDVVHIADGEKYLILVNAGPLASTTFDALKLLATAEANNYAHAKAYVVTTISQRLMANFFLHYFKPKTPIKLFKDTLSAEIWLLRNYRHLLR